MISVIVLNVGNSQFDTASLKVFSVLKYGVKFQLSKHGENSSSLLQFSRTKGELNGFY